MKCDPSIQGIEPFSMHACKEKNRFDWIKHCDAKGHVVPSQLSCLIELLKSDNGNLSSVFMYASIECVEIKTPGQSSVFQQHKYKTRSPTNNALVHSIRRVDDILQPALVIPELVDTWQQVVTMTPANRKKVLFHCIPYELFYRDGWPNALKQDEIRREVHCDKSVVHFLKSNKEVRKKLYDNLLATLAENENDAEVDDDSVIAAALQDQLRHDDESDDT